MQFGNGYEDAAFADTDEGDLVRRRGAISAMAEATIEVSARIGEVAIAAATPVVAVAGGDSTRCPRRRVRSPADGAGVR